METTIHKKIKIGFTFISLLFFSFSYGQLNLPRGSQMATATQRVGISDVSITYSRPQVKGREIWGKLVPYGLTNLGFGTAKLAPWRAGANENTTITFTDDAKVEGKDIKAGTYALFMNIKNENDVSIIFSNNSTSWGSFFYDKNEVALSVDVSAKKAPFTEFLTYTFVDVKPTSTTATLFWGDKRIDFNISFDVSNIVLSDIKNKLKNTAGFSNQSWNQAANYALNNGGDLNEALKWINASISGQFFSQKNYANLFTKYRILTKMNKQEEAYKILEEASFLANKRQLNTMAYQMLNTKQYELALKFFKLNVKNFPKDPNSYDSLGEAYKTIGNKRKAIKYLKKSLSLNPPALVKANSEKLLKELGVKI
jgi:DUF2911 family protein/tetratricopeptide repeat protein